MNINCVLTVPFTLTLQAQGNSAPLTWSIASGQLPTGLSLDAATGTISGTPTENVSQSVTIQATDGKATASQQFNVNAYVKLAIAPVNAVPAHLNAPYSLTISSVASGIANWTIVSGQLPPGLSLQASNVAVISGTPGQAGTFNFTIQAQDYTLPQTATASVSIVVDTHLTLTRTSLKNGGQNLPYSDNFTAVNGTPPLHWSMTGELPAGVSLDTATGKVAGTPTVFGGFQYSVAVSDSSSTPQSDSGQGGLTIAQQLQIVLNAPPIYIGQPSFFGFLAVGGYYPYTWTISAGTLPAGLLLTRDGYISGTPSQLGSSTFTVQVVDSGSPPYVVTQQETLNVVPTLLSVLGPPLSPAPVGVPYHSQIPGQGGTPPYTWTISSGQLPPGLSLDPVTGSIDGTPTQVGTYNFVVAGTDSGVPAQTANANDFIQIRRPLGRNDSIATATPLGNSASSATTVLSISPYIDPIQAATPNPDTDFYKLVATGGSLVHVETLAQRSWGANPLDSVLEILNASGQRYALCTQPLYSSPCLNDDIDSSTLDSALDFKVPGAPTTQTAFYVHVLDWRGDARPDMQYYLNVSGVVDPLVITTSLGIGATRGANYQQQFTAQGGTGSVTWSLDGGALPTGWALSASGLLSGVATTDGSYTFTVKATDSANPPQIARQSYTLTIAEPLKITTSGEWPNACVNQPYTFTVQTTGGLPPLSVSYFGYWVAIGNANNGLTFSGTPDTTGSFSLSLGVIDSATPASVDSQTVTLTVVNCP